MRGMATAPPFVCTLTTSPPQQQNNGIIFVFSNVSIASITDGTSNTLLSGERAHGKFAGGDIYCWNWWTSGNYGDTMFSTLLPDESIQQGSAVCCQDGGPDAYVASASSFHPGGANFGMADGSVRFLKDSVSSWPIQPGTGQPTVSLSGGPGFPVGISRNSSTYVFSFTPGMQRRYLSVTVNPQRR